MIFRYSCSICSRYLRFDGNAWNISGENSIFSLPAFRRGLCCTIIGCLTSRVVFLQRLFSIKGCIPSKVVFHQRSPSIKGCLLSKVVFRQKSSSIKVCLLSKVVHCPTDSANQNIALVGEDKKSECCTAQPSLTFKFGIAQSISMNKWGARTVARGRRIY